MSTKERSRNSNTSDEMSLSEKERKRIARRLANFRFRRAALVAGVTLKKARRLGCR